MSPNGQSIDDAAAAAADTVADADEIPNIPLGQMSHILSGSQSLWNYNFSL